MSAGTASPILEAGEQERAGRGVGLPACQAGMSGATERRELSPQSLTDILAEGEGRVAEYSMA